MHEAQMHSENSFITLTYNDENLPSGNSSCDRCVQSHSLANSVCPHTFSDFMKRLRKSIAPKRVRYYHCGEYGELYKRPHYHALLFGHDFADKKIFSEKNSIRTYTSDDLSRLWTAGYSVIGNVTFESAAYVARYIMKKVTGKNAKEYYEGRHPEYTTMSRRPGIGYSWFEKFQGDVFPHDRVIVRSFPSRPPRFYDDLLGRTDPSTLALLKIKREKNGEHYVNDVLSDGTRVRVSDSSSDRLFVKENCKKAQLLNLKRSLEEQI